MRQLVHFKRAKATHKSYMFNIGLPWNLYGTQKNATGRGFDIGFMGGIKAILSKRMNVNMTTVCKFPIEKSAATFEATVGRSASYEKAK